MHVSARTPLLHGFHPRLLAAPTVAEHAVQLNTDWTISKCKRWLTVTTPLGQKVSVTLATRPPGLPAPQWMRLCEELFDRKPSCPVGEASDGWQHSLHEEGQLLKQNEERVTISCCNQAVTSWDRSGQNLAMLLAQRRQIGASNNAVSGIDDSDALFERM